VLIQLEASGSGGRASEAWGGNSPHQAVEARSAIKPSCGPAPTVVANSTNPSCVNGTNGTITASAVLVGSPPFPAYEYQLSGPVTSGWQSSGTFTGLPAGIYTVSCREVGCVSIGTNIRTLTAPTAATITIVDNITTSSARINWTAASAGVSSYQIRYRVVGAPSWITVTGISSSATSYTFATNTLQNNTQYEVQIASVCTTGGLISNFAPATPVTFTTL
jgi:hypothetical protein